MKKYKCCVCKDYKQYQEFSRDSSRKSGVSSKCKLCMVKYNKNYRNNSIGDKTHRSKESILKRKLSNKLRKRIRDLVRGYNPSNKDIGCTSDFLVTYLESLWSSGMSWDNYGLGNGKWVIDHIRPISNFLKNGEDPRKANHYTNLQPLWFEDNAKKGANY